MKVIKAENQNAAVEKLVDKIAADMQKCGGEFSIAFSGGESSKKLFPALVGSGIDFSKAKIFFVDERCVAPDSEDSNYKWARELFIEPLAINRDKVFRLCGEDCPVKAAESASKAAIRNLSIVNGLPRFDCVILGVGADMHTASIFPDTLGILDSPKIYVPVHPKTSKFWRLTLTGKMLLNASEISVLLLGEGKREILARLEAAVAAGDYSLPSSAILGRAKNATVFAGF